jgi:SAM-dependent methyltransferase
MTVNQFFELFYQELEHHPVLWHYYKFHSDHKSLEFRKAYFCQRLTYIYNAVENHKGQIWDVGCGYGTTAIFLALNGYKVHGTTLEFYYKEIPQRLQFWKQYGDVSGFTYDYENLFEPSKEHGQYEIVIVQDTLHHLEPINKALSIIHDHLLQHGKMIVVEENGANIIQSFKLYLQRGNKRIIEFYDEQLKKKILLGNENIRSLNEWKKVLMTSGFVVGEDSLNYVRVFPPSIFKSWSPQHAVEKEQQLWKQSSIARNYFFFGINFIARPIILNPNN